MSEEKKPSKAATISDIARELNVSKSTVSRALQNHPRIGAETKKAVQDLVKKYNYKPNAIAASLSRKKTQTIGVIVPLLSHYFFSTAIAGIEEVAYKEGYKVMIFQSAESYEREVDIAQTLLKSKVDGLIVSISRQSLKFDHFLEFQERDIPIVFFDRVCPEIDTDSVIVDDYRGAFVATEHLISQGYRKIFHLAGPSSLLISQNRLRGFRDAMQKHQIPLKEEWIIDCGLERKNGAAAAQQLIEQKNLPEAIFAICDPVAIGVILTLKEHGIRVPQDVAMVGFNDDPTATVVEPQLTTIVQPAFEMGEAAAQMCLNQIKTVTHSSQKVFSPKLIIRKSSLRKSIK